MSGHKGPRTEHACRVENLAHGPFWVVSFAHEFVAVHTVLALRCERGVTDSLQIRRDLARQLVRVKMWKGVSDVELLEQRHGRRGTRSEGAEHAAVKRRRSSRIDPHDRHDRRPLALLHVPKRPRIPPRAV